MIKWQLLFSVPFVLCPVHNVAAAQIDLSATSKARFEAELELGRKERMKGRVASALVHFETARREAEANHSPEQQAKALFLVGGSQIRLFRYRDALTSVNLASEFARTAGDDQVMGAAASNRATIYSEVGNYSLAESAAQEAVAVLGRAGKKDYLTRALVNLGDIESDAGHLNASETHLRLAVTTARAAGLKDTEAFADDHLGAVLLENHNLAGAAEALNRSKLLRIELRDSDGLGLTTRDLANLAYQQGHFSLALNLLNQAMRSPSGSLATIPVYWTQRLRGEIQLGLGRKSEALASFSQAVSAADTWRRYALPGDITSTQTSAALHHVYRDFIELAAELSLERHDASLARQALAVLASSRAAGLREQMLASLDRQMQLQLPPRYFELLHQLKDGEASAALGTNPKANQSLTDSLQRTKNELADLENKIGITQETSSSFHEKTLTRNSLTNIQHALSEDQLLLSFSLGKKKSFVWGVSRNRLELYELPAENIIAAHASAFFSTLRNGPASCEGALLNHDLLHSLSPLLAGKKEWLIAADGALLNHVPFAALPVTGRQDSSETLVNLHSLRFLPSEQLLLDPKPARPAPRFIGVADPIYNRADARLPHVTSTSRVIRSGQPVTLARLAGSADEVRRAAKFSGTANLQLLTGAGATEANLRTALATPPSLLHFAVHVISPSGGTPDSSADAALVLSLNANGVPELLTKEAIARLRVPGALVVLSGCASQQGEVVPSAGLIGLGRAWLLAGAAAVIVSAWPTPDDSGEFFSDFYRRLSAKSVSTATLAQRASAALQETQVNMQRSAGYRSSPSFWAAYSMISEE